MRIIYFILVSVSMMTVYSSCARQVSPDVYRSGSVGETMATFSGKIVAVREVELQDDERLQENVLGAIVGGVAGAYAGSKLGKGAGKGISKAAGAGAGAVTGAYTERQLKKGRGFEYIVALDNGQIKTVVQGGDVSLPVEQEVWLLVSQNGRSRIIAK